MSFDRLKATFLELYGKHGNVYAIVNSMAENLRSGEEDYFHVLVFYTSYFIKEIGNYK